MHDSRVLGALREGSGWELRVCLAFLEKVMAESGDLQGPNPPKPNDYPLSQHLGIKYVARSPCCNLSDFFSTCENGISRFSRATRNDGRPHWLTSSHLLGIRSAAVLLACLVNTCGSQGS